MPVIHQYNYAVIQAQYKLCSDLHAYRNCHFNTVIFPTIYYCIEGKRDHYPVCLRFVSNCTEQVSSETGS